MSPEPAKELSAAFERLTVDAARWFEQRVSSSIIESTNPTFGEQRVFLIDGTTFTLAPTDCTICATIHELKIGEERLYIIEDIGATPKQLRDLYWKRNDIEVDIRNIKLVIGTEQIRAQSKDMFLKEFAMAMVTYNLTTQIRREAAKLANCEPRELSFTGVWSVYRTMLQGIEVRDLVEIVSGLHVQKRLLSLRK